jgi:hypothetical protein
MSGIGPTQPSSASAENGSYREISCRIRQLSTTAESHRCCRKSFQRRQILRHRPLLALRVRPVEFTGRFAMIAAIIRFYHAGVDRKTLTFDKAIRHACRDDALKDVA